jgi:hypothetical protein
MNRSMKKRIQLALEERKLANQRLADHLGYSSASVSNMLKSPGDPTVEYVRAAVELTGYSYHWFFTGQGEKTHEVAEPAEVYGPLEQRLLALMRTRKRIDDAIAKLLAESEG